MKAIKDKKYDLIIIGGGASGLSAAIFAKMERPAYRVAVLEKNEIFGKKLRITGNGRGNISNQKIPTYRETMAFFHQIGILTRSDSEGRLYPFSESASEFTTALICQAESLGCDLYLNTLAEKVEKKAQGFSILTNIGRFESEKLILATGGKAGVASKDRQILREKDGYAFASYLGHHILPTTPVLTGVEVDSMPPLLSGIRVKGEVRLILDGQAEPIFAEKGEIQFTDYGLSGICIFNLSRYLKYRGEAKLSPYTIEIDLDPEGQAEKLLRQNVQNPICQRKTLMAILRGIVKEPAAKALLHQAETDGEQLFGTVTGDQLTKLIEKLHHFSFQPKATKGFQMAQCTAGGVSMAELNPETGASKLVPGLYIVGELMDYDGPCGGYNLDHAFRTGMKAAKDALCH